MPAVAPSEFPPPFDSADVIGPPTDAPDDRIEVGVAIVGGGPAGLACANKLLQLLENEPELTEKLGEVPVAVIEKGKVAGAHLLSGANMKPSAMEELFPDLPKEEWPVYQEVTKDAVYLLTKKAALPLVPMPPNFKNHGNYVTSVSKLGRFLADKAEEAGAYILSETAATKLLVEDRVVKGVRSGDRGRGKEGQELGNFEPGSDVVAKTIPSGGYFAMPKRLAVPGMVVAGDAASMVNVPTLKGVHYAMHAGMYAAETIVESLNKDIDSVNFEAYDDKVHNSL